MKMCLQCEESYNPKDSKAANDEAFCSRQCEFHWECENDDEDDG